jgi:hypothetical protein
VRVFAAALGSALLCFGLVAGAGCVDEDNSGCRSDGDCRGVRICRESLCVTPAGLEDDSLGDQGSGEVPELCGDPAEPFLFEIVSDTLDLDALVGGATAVLLGQAEGTFSFEVDGGGALTISLAGPRPIEVDVVEGARLSIRAVEGSFIEVTQEGQLLFAMCSEEVSEEAGLVCGGEGWSVAGGSAPLCEAVQSSCVNGQIEERVRFSLKVQTEAGVSTLYGGQQETVDIGQSSFVHFVSGAYFSPDPCDVPGLVNVAAWKSRRD